jgi:glycosyltransferase involved in cell wall biosynthesis
MKIFFSVSGNNNIGGGFSFARNLWKGLKGQCFLTDNINDDFDIALIIGPTTISRDDVKKIRARNIPIVLRCDNIPEDYRNRGTAISRLKDFSKMADVVVYQSEWARNYVSSLTGVDGAVILNGVDREIFNTNGKTNNKNVLYVRSSTNENKRWQEAKYWFRGLWLKDKDLHFIVVGNFADYIKLYGGDFCDRYRLGLFDEPYTYLGQIKTAEEMATVYKDCEEILVPYYNDACSNTVLEARACGCKINACDSGMSGGTPELLEMDEAFIGSDRMVKDYISLFELTLQ